MPGIIPEAASGAVIIRDALGVCQPPTNVTYSYCPDSAFTSTCEISFLPDGCTARITAAQINAFQSELLCLGEALDPDGNWNCASVCNLSTLFQSWQSGTGDDTMFSQMSEHLCGVNLLTDVQYNALPNAAAIICDGAGNLRRYQFPGPTAQEMADAICADTDAAEDLAACLVTAESICNAAGNMPVAAQRIGG